MKKILFTLLTTLCFLSGYSNSFYFAWDGFGVATKYNYDLGFSYGAYYYRGVARGLALGTYEFYQTYNQYYSREMGNTMGQSIRTKVQYRIFSPMVVLQLCPSGQAQMYFTGGIGELQSGAEATHEKWSRTSWNGDTYNATEDFSEDLNKYIVRMGFGFTQFQKIGGIFHLFVNEDFGFLANSMTDLSTGRFAGMRANPGQFFTPTYVSLRVGLGLITHSKNKIDPWQIYAGRPVE